jgi:hypothetical protein
MKRLLLISLLLLSTGLVRAQLSFAPPDSLYYTSAGHFSTYPRGSAFPVDFNHDGFDDVLTLKGSDLFLSLNSGVSTLEEEILLYSDEEHIYSISNFEDINDDTYPDVAISTADGIKVLYASGNEYVKVHEVAGAAFNYYTRLILNDNDQDEKTDLTALLQNSIFFFKDVNTGLAQKSTFHTEDVQIHDFHVEDLNTDNQPDLIISVYNEALKIYHGNPNKTFTHIFSAPVTNLASFEVADLNLDGFQDIAYMEWGVNIFTLIYDNSSETFTQQAVFADDDKPNNIASFDLVDLRNNNTPDLVFNDFPYLRVKENNGLGQFLPEVNLFESFLNPFGFYSFNLNNDGIEDIVLSDYNKFQVVSFKADGTVDTQFVMGYLDDFWDIIFHDVDSDGFKDIVSVSRTGSFTVRWGTDVFDYSEFTKYEIPFNCYYGAMTDVNGDGHDDIFITQESDNNGINDILIVENKGNRDFDEARSWKFFPDPAKPLIGDIDKDGIVDVLSYVRYSNEIMWFDIDSDTYDEYFSTSRKFSIGGNGLRDLVSKDINNDGYTDLLTANTTSKNISILINNASGNFTETLLTPDGTVSEVTGVQLFDYDEDDFLDVLAIVRNNPTTWSLQVFLNDQLGDFSYEATHALQDIYQPERIHVLDIDADGDLDLLVAAWDHLSTNIFLRADEALNNIGPGLITNCGQSVRIYEDVNRDGKPDVYTANLITGRTFLQLNNSVKAPESLETEITLEEIKFNSVIVKLSPTSSSGRLVVVTTAEDLSATPDDGFFYTSNPKFGTGSKLDENAYVVERGAKETLEITGLSSSTRYQISVFEFNVNAPQVTIINYSDNKVQSGFTTPNMPPQVAAIADQSGTNQETVSVILDITDNDNLPGEFEYAFTSSNPEVVPVSNIVVTVEEELAVLKITPIDFGESLIELTVSDTAKNTAVVTFKYTSLVVGVEEGQNSGFAVYPNPFKAVVNVKHSQSSGKHPMRKSALFIYNTKGEVVREFEYIPEEVDLSISPPGIYFFKTSGGDQYKAVKE